MRDWAGLGPRAVFQKQDLDRVVEGFPAETSPVKVRARDLALQLEELSEWEVSPVEPTKLRAPALGPPSLRSLMFTCPVTSSGWWPFSDAKQ